MIGSFQGLLSGFTKHAYLHCLWDSGGRMYHYTTRELPAQEELVLRRARRSTEELLGNRDKILVPQLHIKQCLMMQLTNL